jgi:hypothetical protein
MITKKKGILKRKIKKRGSYIENRPFNNEWRDLRGQKLLNKKEYKKYLAEGGI